MKRYLSATATLAPASIIALLISSNSMAECFELQGKIFNSSHNPALGSIGPVPIFNPGTGKTEYQTVGGASTLGVVALNGGKQFGKMKCALVGVWAGPGEGQEWDIVGVLPKFTHTISCDDAVPSPVGDVHSQLTFDTSGDFTGYDGAYTFSFLEYSSAIAGTGKGAFVNTTDGQLEIDGTLNILTGSIDMSFTGEVCMD